VRRSHKSTAVPADRTLSPRTASPAPMRAPLHDRAKSSEVVPKPLMAYVVTGSTILPEKS
jgi:hypothetical protein